MILFTKQGTKNKMKYVEDLTLTRDMTQL